MPGVRALINSSRPLLTDEPTRHLDEDGEADSMELEALRRSEGLVFVLITHNLELADGQRTYEMRQGILAPAALPQVGAAAPRHPRHFGPAEIQVGPDSTLRPRRATPPRGGPLGANFLRALAIVLLAWGAVIHGILLSDFWAAKCQQIRIRERAEQIARLADLALSSLQTEIQSISDLYQIICSKQLP